MDSPWYSGVQALNCKLGDIKLFSLSFPAKFRNADTNDSNLAAVERAFVQECPPYVQAVLMYSHPITEEPERVSFLPDAIRYVPRVYERYYIDLSGSFEDYLKRFSSKSRSTLLRKVSRFTREAGTDPCWQIYSSPAELTDFYAKALELSKKTYQHKLFGAGLPDNPGFREKMLRLATEGSAMGALLFFQGTPVAYMYCPSVDGTLQYEEVGYDQEYRDYSPGTVLQYFALQWLFSQQRFRGFDFTEGEGQHKRFFATDHLRCANFYFFRRNLRNLTIIFIHQSFDRVSGWSGRLLEMMKLKHRLKRALRSL